MNGHDPDQDLGRRLRALVDHHVPESTRQQHLSAIDAELARHHAAAPAPALTLLGNAVGRSWTRRWAAGVATATALFLPAGAAVAAAQSALPGDMLYPVKQLSEPVRSVLFDPDVAARHRLDELESLQARGSSPEMLRSAADAARLAVAGLPEHHPLHERLAALLALLAPPRTSSNDRAAVPAPRHSTQPADAHDAVDNDADDDTDRAEPHDEHEPHEVDDDVETEHSDDTDGEDEDEQESVHHLDDSELTDENGPDDDDVEDSDDIDEPDSDEVEDHHAVEPTEPDDDEEIEEDADDD